MSIIAWALLGLGAGAIAKIGVVGAVIGGFLWNLLSGNDSYGEFDLGGILIAVLGSVILLIGYRRFAAQA